MSQADRIIDKFGGRAQLSRISRYSYEQLRYIQNIKGVFPAEDYGDLITLGVEHGVEITPYDFIAHLCDPRAANLKSTSIAAATTGLIQP